ncbi:MAG TPA: hypothetical protein VE996_08190 [Terriglobales bacterium]|nr:hypothetical protein [Terriglobales bacterium]
MMGRGSQPRKLMTGGCPLMPILLWTLLAPALPQGPGAPVMRNADVIALTRAGIAPGVIMAKIRSTPCAFVTSPAALERLKSDGVAAPVILAMVQARCDPVAPASSRIAAARVFVTASPTESGRWFALAGSSGAAAAGASGVDPQRNELIKTLLEKCRGVAVMTRAEDAEFHLDLEREPNKGFLWKRDKWVLVARDGGVIGAGSARSLGGVARSACALMGGIR